MKSYFKPAIFMLAVLIIPIIASGCGDKEPQPPVVRLLSKDSLTVIPDEDTQVTSPLPFCESDLAISDSLLIGMTPDYVRSAMGEPNIENTTENPVYGTIETLTYDGLSLGFCDVIAAAGINASTGSKELYDAICRTPRIKFARGLHVGCNVKEVLASFADDQSGRALYFNSLKPNGTMIYGDFSGGKQHEDTRSYAYIDRSSLDSAEAKYYSVNYCFEKPLTIYHDNTGTDLCETYIIQFFIDIDDDSVSEIRLTHTAETWALPAHFPDN